MSNYHFIPYQSHQIFYLSPYNLTLNLSIDGLSPWRSEFDFKPDNVEIILDKTALKEVYLENFGFSLFFTIPAMIYTN
jgi:hypothetical protein